MCDSTNSIALDICDAGSYGDFWQIYFRGSERKRAIRVFKNVGFRLYWSGACTLFSDFGAFYYISQLWFQYHFMNAKIAYFKPNELVLIFLPWHFRICRIAHSTHHREPMEENGHLIHKQCWMLFHSRILLYNADAGKYSISNTWLVFRAHNIVILCYVACDGVTGPLFSGQKPSESMLLSYARCPITAYWKLTFFWGGRKSNIPFRSYSERVACNKT